MSSEYLFKATKAKTNTVYEKVVLILLSDIADNKGSCYPSLAYLTEGSSCSRNTVKKALNGLVDAGMLRIEHRSIDGVNTSNRYHITLGVGQEVTHSVTRCRGVGQEMTEGRSGDDPNTLTYTLNDTNKHICSNWQDWVDHRKQLRKPLTKVAIDRQIKFLEQFSEETKVKIIEQSILRGWSGLFELKGESHENNQPTGNRYKSGTAAHAAAKLRERLKSNSW